MAVKVKELKDDAVIEVQVNKSYYLMLKEALHFLFNLVPDEKQRAELFMKLPDIEYNNMESIQRAFFTITLMLAEIERVASEKEYYQEKTILEPDDEGYVPPTEA
jgi:hypothetical protein